MAAAESTPRPLGDECGDDESNRSSYLFRLVCLYHVMLDAVQIMYPEAIEFAGKMRETVESRIFKVLGHENS